LLSYTANGTEQSLLFFYCVKQKRKYHNRHAEAWTVVALYDSEGHFRGQSVFTSRKEASDYLIEYRKRLQNRNSNNSELQETELKVVRETEKPELVRPSLFYRRQNNNNNMSD
jgi:hypothetical protein